MKMQWILVIGLLFAIAVAIFATVNVTEVPINYVFGEARWPLVLVIFGSVFAGVVISLCFSLFLLQNGRLQVYVLFPRRSCYSRIVWPGYNGL